MSKVKIDVIKPWITKRITEILGFEDDVVIDFCFNLLEKTEVSVFCVCVAYVKVCMDVLLRYCNIYLQKFNVSFFYGVNSHNGIFL